MSRYIRGDVIDPDVTISRSDGSVLCTKSALTSPVELTCTLDATGEHAIIAADLGRDETGDYCISLQRMNGPAKVIPISYGSGRTNFIYVPCAIHAYAFNGAAGDRVAVRMARTSGIFPDLRLHRPDGSQLCGDSTLEPLRRTWSSSASSTSTAGTSSSQLTRLPMTWVAIASSYGAQTAQRILCQSAMAIA